MLRFYGTLYITLHWVLAAGDKPPALQYTMERMRTSSYAHAQEPHFHRIPYGESANLKLRTRQEPHLRKNEIVEPCEAFHCERCFPELHFQQSLKPMLPLSEALPSLNAPTSDKMSPASSKSAACVYGRRLRQCLQITLYPSPAKRELCYLKSFGSFLQKRTPP